MISRDSITHCTSKIVTDEYNVLVYDIESNGTTFTDRPAIEIHSKTIVGITVIASSYQQLATTSTALLDHQIVTTHVIPTIQHTQSYVISCTSHNSVTSMSMKEQFTPGSSGSKCVC